MSIRKIYNVQALFAGPPTPSGDHFSSGNSGVNYLNQIHRVQTANESVNIARQMTNQLGQLSTMSFEIVEPPSATLDFSYYVTNVLNEKNLGLTVDGTVSAISGLLTATTLSRNYFILSVPEGNDAVGYDVVNQPGGVIAFGNGFLGSLAFEGSVGNFPTATVNVQALNYKVDTGTQLQSVPAINPELGIAITGKLYSIPQAVSGVAGQTAIIKPGDITVDIAGGPVGLSLSDLKIQSYNISANFNLTPQQKLGSLFAFARLIQFPLQLNASITANVGDLAPGNLVDIRCNDVEYDLAVTLRKPSCSGNGTVAAKYTVKGAKLESQSQNMSIGANKSVTLNYVSTIGAPQDVTHTLFISGSLV